MGTRPALGAQRHRSPGTRGHLLLAPLETQMETQNPVPRQIPTPGGAAKAEAEDAKASSSPGREESLVVLLNGVWGHFCG